MKQIQLEDIRRYEQNVKASIDQRTTITRKEAEEVADRAMLEILAWEEECSRY